MQHCHWLVITAAKANEFLKTSNGTNTTTVLALLLVALLLLLY